MLSLCSRFLEIVLLLLVRKSVLIRSSLSTHCWEVVDIALLLVVVFLSIMSSISKVTIVWRSLSFKSLFQKHGLILHILRSTMFQSFWYAYCWKAIELRKHYVVILLNFDVTPASVMKMHAIWEKLNKTYVAKLKWQHLWTIYSFSNPHRFHKRNLYINKDIWKKIYFVYVASHLMCASKKHLVIMIMRSKLPHHWIQAPQ